MRRLVAALTAPLLAVSLLSGCGGDESSDDESTAAGESASTSPSPDGSASKEPAAPEDAASDAPGAGTKYCKLLSTDFATLFANIKGPEDVSNAIGIIKQIGATAPPEVEDEWRRMQGALGQVEGALTQAARLQQKAKSGEVSQKKLQSETARLTKQMQSLNTPANAKAGEVVAKNATKYCGLSLG